MPRTKRKQLIIGGIALAVIAAVAVGYVASKPHINRWLDNRQRAIIYQHRVRLEDKVQQLAHQKGAYPSFDTVKQLVHDSSYKDPHTGASYGLIPATGITDDGWNLRDGQIAYGPDDAQADGAEDGTVNFCIGVGMPRTDEDGWECDTLRLDKNTDLRIKYALSCKTNWLGFSTGCDQSLFPKD